MPGGETDQEREQKAHDLAYERGRQAAENAAHFREHDRHLDAINGSVEKLARAFEDLSDEHKQFAKDVGDEFTGVKVELATQRTKLAFYAGLGSLIGGGAVTLIVGFTTRIAGG